MRLIDADKLKEDLRGWLALPNRDNDARDVILHQIAAIDNAPTVEERPQGDLISREALKKAISENGYSHYYEIFAIIDNAPTVEERPQSGQVVPDVLQGWRYEEKGGAE